MEHENPYQAPGATSPQETLQEGRVLSATFDVDRALIARSLRFLTEDRLQSVNLGLALSFLLLLALLLGMILPMPRTWWFALLVLFFVLQAALVGWQSWHVRRQVKRWERDGAWPAQLGNYQVEVTLDQLTLRVEQQRHAWPLSAISHAYYLGDVLLLVSESGRLIPVPRTADFGADDFASFCRAFAIRYRPAAGEAS